MLQKCCYSIMISLLLTNTVMAASFDCKKATKKIETAICNNHELDQIDTQLGQIYEQLYQSLPKPEANQLRKGQIAWLKQRDQKCAATDMNCLSEFYADRTAILKSQLSTESSKKTTKSMASVTPKLDAQSKVLLRSIGPITFGMSIKQAEATIGSQFSVYEATDNCQILTPTGSLKDEINFVAVNDQIVAANIYTGKITTRSGIGINSLESQILSKYSANIQLLETTVVDGDEFRMLAFVPKDEVDKDYRIIFTIFDNKVHSFSTGKMPFVKENCRDANAVVEEDEVEETALLDKLQGKWQSTEDNASIIEINENIWTDIYDNEEDTGVHFDITTACLEQGGQIDENGGYLQVGGSDGFCYSIDQVDADNLVLMYLPRGSLLTYKRK